MMLFDKIQTGDWKGEKHVPVIDAPATVKAGERFDVTLTVGKEIAHPNTPEHFIAWIKLFFVAEDEKFAVELGTLTFDAHGANPAVQTEASGKLALKLNKSGKLTAVSYCNLHGLWASEHDINVEG